MSSIAEGQVAIETIRQIQSTENVDDAVRDFVGYIYRYGFSVIHIGQLVNPMRVPTDQRILVSTWPNDYQKLRRERHRFIQDPLARHARRTKKPFRWSDIYRICDDAGKAVLDEAREFDLADGLVIPVANYDSVPGAVSIGTDSFEIGTPEIDLLHLVCQTTYSHIERLLGVCPFQIKAHLTPREREVLTMAAAGKTNPDIAIILGLSEYTVRDYFSAISKKLESTTRTHSVAIALARDLILP